MKAPKPSMKDRMASLSSGSVAAQRHNVVQSEHGAVVMASGASVEAVQQDGAVTALGHRIGTDKVVAPPPVARSIVKPRQPKPVRDAAGKRLAMRHEKSHTSLYLHPRVLRLVKEIALAEDLKPHDVLMHGIRLVLNEFGYDLDRVERGE